MFKVGDKVYFYDRDSLKIDGEYKSVCSFIEEVVITKVNKTSYSVEHFVKKGDVIKNIKFADISDNVRVCSWKVAKDEEVERFKAESLEYKVIVKPKSEEYDCEVSYYTRLVEETEAKIGVLQQETARLNGVLDRKKRLKTTSLHREKEALENLKKLIG
ncbi:MAG: hypothetical protein ACRC6A_09265 [Fusobacteriaceae bacterium]